MHIKALLFAAAILCTMGTTALCQQGPATQAPKIACDGALYDFGVQDEAVPVKREFLIRNDGDADLLIHGVRTSCGCTAASPSTNRLAPGDRATVAVTLSLRGRRGAQSKNVSIESNDPAQPVFVLTLSGTAMTELCLEPTFITFGSLDAASNAAREVRLISLKPNVQITNALCDSPYFRVEVVKTQPGRPPAVMLSTVPPLPDGQTRGTLHVYTDHPKRTELQATVMAIVLPEVRVIPDEIVVRGQPGGEAKRAALRVLPCATRDYEVLSVVAPLPTIETSFKKTATGNYLIDITNLPCGPELNGKSIVIHTTLGAMRDIVVPIRFIQESPQS